MVTRSARIYWLLTAPVNKVWMRDQKLSGGAQKFFGSGGAEDPRTGRNCATAGSVRIYRALAAGAAFLLLSIALVK